MNLLLVILTIGQPLAALPPPPGTLPLHELPQPPGVKAISADVLYNRAYDRALAIGRPFIVFVGVPEREVKTAVTTWAAAGSMPKKPHTGVLVLIPYSDGTNHYHRDLLPNATDAEIVASFAQFDRKAVAAVVADPFLRIQQAAVDCPT